MKPISLFIAGFMLLPVVAAAQGTFIYDQQSSVEGNYSLDFIFDIQGAQPIGQSFTPALDSVGFIRMVLNDNTQGNTRAGTIYLNLRSGSITGPLLASTEPVQVPVGTQGPINFYFASPVPVTPGTTYYFQPWIQSGNTWGCNLGPYNYPGGMVFTAGIAGPAMDLWFREGIVVPEPTAGALVLLAGATGAWALGRRRDGQR